MILLIDCSKGLRLIIGNKQRIVANKSKPRLKKVSERLIVEIKILLDSIKKDYQNLSKIIVINGPGSFTGIRTGITAAKVLGLSLKLPVCGISLFELLRLNYLKTKSKKNLKFLIKLNKDNYFTQNVNKFGKESKIILESFGVILQNKSKEVNFVFLDNISVKNMSRKVNDKEEIITINDLFNKTYRDLINLSEKKYIPSPIYVKTF
ncbi:tRNA (adenosine(37)-N6)-threonylcarbamoyltransferase complex dimerization subunit type 1 TsaB [Pelagibacteraceae bacterium]|nr:tRNA (adenosine(37)-N6)-threonylcarbamoyltransferase complex dimerization subunit type 1 TsaB [Pelagibacteraceae bacterium]